MRVYVHPFVVARVRKNVTVHKEQYCRVWAAAAAATAAPASGTGDGLLEQSITRTPFTAARTTTERRWAAAWGPDASAGNRENRSAPRRVRNGPCGGALPYHGRVLTSVSRHPRAFRIPVARPL